MNEPAKDFQENMETRQVTRVCPYCGAKLIEARVTRRNGADKIDPKGPNIKTKCEQGHFIGYRPAEPNR